MATKTWVVDPLHSEIQFKIKHLVISSITGAFKNFSGGASAGDNFEDAEIHFSLDASSISTNLEARDNHLRSADFFDVDNHPHITFRSIDFRKVKGDKFKLTGQLTLRGITKPIELDAEYGGAAVDVYGNNKIGFEVIGFISRWEFGLNYNALTDTGGLVVGEEVKLIANIQLQEQA